MLNLDTHILLFSLSGEISPQERRMLREDEWGISDIVLWEISKLSQLGKIQIDLRDRQFERLIGGLTIWPITLDVCRAMQSLDFRSDPAAEIIAATSIVHRAPLVTRDRRIRKSALVPLAGN